MEKIGFNYLVDELSLREVPLASDIIDLIHPDRERALKQFAKLVQRGEREYSKHSPVCLYKKFYKLQMDGYVFEDNFDSYLQGNIKEEDIQLIPEAIAVVSSGWANYPTSNVWAYVKPTFKSVGGTTSIKYYAFHPIRYTISPDGRFSEDSYVYYISPNDDTFINQIALEVLTYLKQTRDAVIQPTGLSFFDFTQRIQDLTASVNNDYAVSSSLYEMYGIL